MSFNILTNPGGEFALSDSYRQVICYLDDGRLFISKSHEFTPYVRAFIARIERMGRTVNVQKVDLSVIADLYAQHNENVGLSGKTQSASQMQRDAMDMFRNAVSMRASDIHIRVSKRERTRIYYRIHNDLEYIGEHPTVYGEQLCAAIYQSMADVSDATFETLSRQDARISDKTKLPEQLDGIRVATSPHVDGALMVLRLLYNDATESTDMADLGYSQHQCEAMDFIKRKPSGLNIIGGPTGSGKSTSLQRMLTGILRESRGKRHIITVEDPPEYPIPGAVQTPVTNADTEEDRAREFQKAIKASMRLDPDVIMVGEVRDRPSAQLVVQAAMTGHQVWTTVHANNAFAIIDRLIDIGIPKEVVCDSSIVTGLICQRLVRVLCPKCKVRLSDAIEKYRPIDVNRMMKVGPIQHMFVLGDGCPHCSQKGIVGRTALAEVVVTDEPVMTLLRRGDRSAAIEYWRREQSGKTMLEVAIEKINQGSVDPFQAEGVVGPLNTIFVDKEHPITKEERDGLI